MLRKLFFQAGRILKKNITDIGYQYHAAYAARRAVDGVWLIWAATSFGGLLICAQAYALETARTYHIPAQSLNNALIEFAAAARLELIFSADLVRGLNSPGLDGEMTREQALNRLLQNSGFGYRFVASDTVTLEPLAAAEPKPLAPAPVTLEPMTVVGQQPGTADAHLDTAAVLASPIRYQLDHLSSATRTDTPLRQIPQSVQAIERNLLDDQQNITVSETLINVSGIVPRNTLYTPVIEGTLIRGFRSEQLIDGFTQYYNPGDRESTVNIERIEVLKGSNALLYSGGSGAPVGGVVNLLSKLPKPTAFAEVGVKIGEDSFYQPYFDVNQPVNRNAQLRLTAEYTNARHAIDLIDTRRYNVNPALILTDNDRTRFTVQGKFSRWQQPEYQGLPAIGSVAGSFRIPRDMLLGPGDLPDSHSESAAVWATLEHRIDQIWWLSAKARLARSEFDEKIQTLFGADGFVADRPLLGDATWALVNAELFQEQQERSVLGNLLAKFRWGPSENQLLLGADHSELNDAGFVDGDFGAFGLGAGLLDLRAPSFGSRYQTPGPGVNNQFIQNLTYGGYVQWQSTWYQHLHLLAGLRLSSVAIDFNNTLTGVSARTDTLKWLPRVGAVLDLHPQVSWFVSYSEGLRGQPFVNFVDTPLPELSRHLETGFKFDIAKQLTGQLALYQIDRSQVAVSDSSDIQRRSVAAGQQRSRGIEADLLWQPLVELSVLANYAHTDARFVDDKAGVPAGNRLAMVPEDSGRLWANYRFSQAELRGWSAGFGVYLRSGAYLSNNNAFKTGGYHSFDAALAYETRRFKWAATVKNLGDTDYFQPYGYFDGRVAPSQGRAAYLTFSMRY